MKIAVTYDNGQIFQHFGHCENFKIYEIRNNSVTSSAIINAYGSGHGALAGFLNSYDVDALICGGIGQGARTALSDAGIELYPGVSGDADSAVSAFISGTLSYDPDTVCKSHHHSAGHSCGENKHECHGNH